VTMTRDEDEDRAGRDATPKAIPAARVSNGRVYDGRRGGNVDIKEKHTKYNNQGPIGLGLMLGLG
jgi:hypothetical protein